MSSIDAPQASRKGILALVGFAGLALLVLVYVFVVSPLLGGGTEDVAAVEPAPTATEPSPEPGTTPVPGNGLHEPVSETFEVFTARDPFQQLVVVPASSGGSGGSGDGDGSETPTASPTTPPAAVVGATTIRLVDVFTDDDGVEKVLVTVNGTGYEVAEGETFAQRFRVLDITGSCATMLFGDSRFTLCQGEEIRK